MKKFNFSKKFIAFLTVIALLASSFYVATAEVVPGDVVDAPALGQQSTTGEDSEDGGGADGFGDADVVDEAGDGPDGEGGSDDDGDDPDGDGDEDGEIDENGTDPDGEGGSDENGTDPDGEGESDVNGTDLDGEGESDVNGTDPDGEGESDENGADPDGEDEEGTEPGEGDGGDPLPEEKPDAKAAAFGAGLFDLGDETFEIVNVDNPGSGYSYDDASKTITIELPGNYEISGTTNEIQVTVAPSASGANITLNNVSIDVSGISGACAIEIQPGATANLILAAGSENVLKSGLKRAGIEVTTNANVKISGDSSVEESGGYGTLDVTSVQNLSGLNNSGAGIGSSSNSFSGGYGGKIEICEGAKVTATSFGSGAGIGGGSGTHSGGSGGLITISGSKTVVNANSNYGAGIGGGGGFNTNTNIDGNGGIIEIRDGAKVTTNSNYGAGIGGGGFSDNMYVSGQPDGGSGGSITIHGDGTIVNAKSKYGAGIGGGYAGVNENTGAVGAGGDGGKIEISDGAKVTATSTDYGAGIGGGYGEGGNGDGGEISIDESATVRAYARDNVAIQSTPVSVGAHIINAYFVDDTDNYTSISDDNETTILSSLEDKGISLPKASTSFAYNADPGDYVHTYTSDDKKFHWFDASDGLKLASASTDMVAIPLKPGYLVTFDANGGTFPDGLTQKFEAASLSGEEKVTKPADPNPSSIDDKFNGWIAFSDTEQIEFDLEKDPVDKNLTLKAEYINDPWEVTFDANGGTFPEGFEDKIYVQKSDSKIPKPADPNPPTSDYVFDKWTFLKNGKWIEWDFDDGVVEQNLKLKATYSEIPELPEIESLDVVYAWILTAAEELAWVQPEGEGIIKISEAKDEGKLVLAYEASAGNEVVSILNFPTSIDWEKIGGQTITLTASGYKDKEVILIINRKYDHFIRARGISRPVNSPVDISQFLSLTNATVHDITTGTAVNNISATITATEYNKIKFYEVGVYTVNLTATKAAPYPVQVNIYAPSTGGGGDSDDDDNETEVVTPPTVTEPEDTNPGDETPDGENPDVENNNEDNTGDGNPAPWNPSETPGGDGGDSGSYYDNDSSYNDSPSDYSFNESTYTAPEGAVSASLSDGTAVVGVFDEDSGLWTIFDENGTPLGSVYIPEGKTLEEVLLAGEMIPLGANGTAGDSLLGDRDGNLKTNPKTGDVIAHYGFFMLAFLGVLLLTAGVYRKTRKQMSIR